jgi:hypothetical protein
MNFLAIHSQLKRKSLKFSLSLMGLSFAQIFCSKDSSGQAIQNKIGSPFSLFANHDLSAWTQQGNANWNFDVYKNELSANQGAGYILSRLPLADSELTMEYWVDRNSVASLGLRCGNPYLINTDNSYQVSLSEHSNNGFAPGSLIGIAKASKNAFKPGWNDLFIKLIGNQITIVLNKSVVISSALGNRFSQGQVAVILSSGVIKIRSLNVTIPGRW